MSKRLIKWLRWLRPIECNNFDCCYEWGGVCRAKKLDFVPITSEDRSTLVCKTFKQVPY